MTNSVKKAHYLFYCSGSNSEWKRRSNRKLRRINNQLIKIGKELQSIDEVTNIYNSPKDGSGHYTGILYSQRKEHRPRGVRIIREILPESEWWVDLKYWRK